MCGLAGAINFPLNYTFIDAIMRHRGPDEQAGYSYGNVSFYHQRLSIIDISGGKQPMHLHEKYTIIFNGEIYNHREIRSRFNIEGHTSSDTETLLLLYERFGTEFLEYLDGMFAFVIHDKTKNLLFVARDRAGKKPFYYYCDEEKLVFASELNCLKGLVPLQINENNIYHYFRLGSFYKEMTPYKNVNELNAGSFLIIDCNTLKIQTTRWWNINDFYSLQNNDTLDEAIQKIDEYLHTAIKRRLESSDLEVGCFLSGGIDSSLITAIASGYNSKLKTFTVSFDGEYNEAPLAKLVADKYQTCHTEIRISSETLMKDFATIIGNYGEPFFDSSAIPSFYISREAKKYLTVILTGDGADELFAGYRRYVPFAKYDFFKRNAQVRNSASLIKKILPPGHTKNSHYNYLYRLASLASKSNIEIYLSAGIDIFEDCEQFIRQPDFDYMLPIKNDFNGIANSNLSGLKKIMNLDFDTNLFSDLLVKMDVATMAHSLEGRSPFLSKEILEYAPSMDDKFKIKGTKTKFLLRQLSKNYLPDKLINQPKRGFEIPLKIWVDHTFKDMVYDYIYSASSYNKSFIDKDFVRKLLEKKIPVSEEKRAKILWALLCLEIWYKKIYLE